MSISLPNVGLLICRGVATFTHSY